MRRAWLVLVVACGGGGAPLSEGLRDELHAYCAKAFDCEASYLPAMHQGMSFESAFGTSAADCYDKLIRPFEGCDEITGVCRDPMAVMAFAAFDASVAAGRIKYNAGALQSCIDGLGGQSCDAFFMQNGASVPANPACETAIQGQVADGGACTISADCSDPREGCDPQAHVCKP